jgi:hypothetical protein
VADPISHALEQARQRAHANLLAQAQARVGHTVHGLSQGKMFPRPLPPQHAPGPHSGHNYAPPGSYRPAEFLKDTGHAGQGAQQWEFNHPGAMQGVPGTGHIPGWVLDQMQSSGSNGFQPGGPQRPVDTRPGFHPGPAGGPTGIMDIPGNAQGGEDKAFADVQAQLQGGNPAEGKSLADLQAQLQAQMQAQQGANGPGGNPNYRLGGGSGFRTGPTGIADFPGQNHLNFLHLLPLGQGLFLHPGTGEIHGLGPAVMPHAQSQLPTPIRPAPVAS